MAFSCLSLSISHNITVACFSYVIRCIRCWMTVMPVLCYRLNKYLAYLAIAAQPTSKCGLFEVRHGLEALLPHGALLIVD
jgi:hypothetical protein